MVVANQIRPNRPVQRDKNFARVEEDVGQTIPTRANTDDEDEMHVDSHIPATGGKRVLTAGQLAKMQEARKNGSVKLSTRCGLHIPPNLVKRRLAEDRYTAKVSMSAAIFLAGALEALIGDVIDNSLLATKEAQKKSMTAQHLLKAVRSDEELSKVFRHAIFAQGGTGGICTVPKSHKSSSSKVGKEAHRMQPRHQPAKTNDDAADNDDDDDDADGDIEDDDDMGVEPQEDELND